MAWVQLGVAAIGLGAAYVKSNPTGQGGAASPGAVTPAMQRGGDMTSITDHSNWTVNFGDGNETGAQAAPIPWGIVGVGFAVWYLNKKMK